MKVMVVGSGSMWTRYNSACYMVDDNIMVDFPNGACKYLYRGGIDVKTINHVLITHFHGDHYFDVPFYVLKKSKSDDRNSAIYCSKEGKSKIKKIGYLAFPNSFDDAVKDSKLKFCHDEEIKINNYTIHKVLVDHGRMKPAYGYIFNAGDKVVGFTGDTSLCDNVELMANKCSYLFCDCMRCEGNSKHMGIDNLEYLSKTYITCTFVVSHLDDETRDALIKLNLENVIVPEDYQIFNI